MSEQANIISMKLLVDARNHKVLFAEAGKDCVDFFFHILSLPLGAVVGYLTKTSMVGSIGSLYGSLENLGTNYIQDGLDKDCLLNPNPAAGSSSQVPLLTINQAPYDDSAAKKFYTCIPNGYAQPFSGPGSTTITIHRYVSDAAGATCPTCHVPLKTELKYVAPPSDVKKKAQSSSSVGGCVKGVVTYMIMDDLSIKPMSTISSIALLNKFNIQDVASLEEREVSLDIDLGMALLKASLSSKTVLTDVFLPKKP